MWGKSAQHDQEEAEELREKADTGALPKDGSSISGEILQEAHKGSCCTQQVQGKPPKATGKILKKNRNPGKRITFYLLSKNVFSAR